MPSQASAENPPPNKEKNEIADFLSSAGIDTDEIKNSSEVDSSDQLQVSSYFVKYCINAEKQNFNSIDWSTGDDSGNYSFPEKEEFSSEDDYNTIIQSDSGLTVAMTFGEDILKSYHLQLKHFYLLHHFPYMCVLQLGFYH